MKTMYFRSIMTGLLMVGLFLLLPACQTPISVPTPLNTPPTVSTPTASTAMPPAKPQPVTFVFLPKQIDESFLQGAVDVPVKGNILQNWYANRLPVPNLGELKTAGPTPRLMAFGDGLVAGWRDGGYFLEGQQTAFPNLIARQMGITDFKSPLFDEAHGNGTGYLILAPTATGPRWKEVTNNKAILKIDNLPDPPELIPYDGGKVHNLGIPKLTDEGGRLSPPPPAKGWVTEGGVGFTQALPFFWRMFPGVDRYKVSYFDVRQSYIQEKKFDLGLVLFGLDGWMQAIIKGNNENLSQNLSQGMNDAYSVMVGANIKRSGIDVITFTFPDFQHMAYFNWFTKQDLQALPGKVNLSLPGANTQGNVQVESYLFLPTPGVEAMFERARRGENFLFGLPPSDMVDAKEVQEGSPRYYNQRLRSNAARDGLLVVDLEALYKSIYEGNYITEDGFRIDGSPRGNFFSADGIYPSAIGNAVIANETIKVINRAYKASIPLINVREFAQSLDK